MLDINQYRDKNEQMLFLICAIYGGSIWLMLIIFTFGIALLFIPFFAGLAWVSHMYLKAVIYAQAIKVSDQQYPEINTIVDEQCAALGLKKPDVFLLNGSGMINAFAMRMLSGQFVILYSDLVDLMLEREEMDELKVVIGHELAHHAAGHTNLLKSILISPARGAAFIGPAYSRSCEHTCDRIGAVLGKDITKAKRALASITSGSRALASHINLAALEQQDKEAPQFFITFHEFFSTHPRLIERIRYLDKYGI